LEETASSRQAVAIPAVDPDLRDPVQQTDVAAAAPKRRRFSFF
jgi:hypothetical protein